MKDRRGCGGRSWSEKPSGVPHLLRANESVTRQLAEDLQDSAARVIDKPNHAPPDEGIVPWFYRVLRNSAIDDRRRRRGTAARALEACARKLEPMTPLSLSWRLKFAGA